MDVRLRKGKDSRIIFLLQQMDLFHIIEEVPDKMEILVLFSFRDLEDRHVITEGEIYDFIQNQPKNVRMLEVSLKNCFGFKELQ